MERLSWSCFKKGLATRLDKKALDGIFENAELYVSYLSNAVNPVPLESVMMGALFHSYKILLDLDKEKEGDIPGDDATEERQIKLQLLADCEPTGNRLLFDRTCEKWQGLIDSLHREDGELLLKLILEICINRDNSYNQTMAKKDSEPCIDYPFFISLIVLQQKLINEIGEDANADRGSKNLRDTKLIEFME
jgi:hypothetical protein